MTKRLNVFGMIILTFVFSAFIFMYETEGADDEFDKLYAFKCVENGLWGFRDFHGNVVIEPKFHWAADFFDGLAAVILREWDLDNEEPFYIGSPGPAIFIDRTGQNVFGEEFPAIHSVFNGGLAIVTLPNGNRAFIDRTGQNAFGMEFAYIRGTFDEIEYATVVLLNGRAHFIDRLGNLSRARPGPVHITYGEMTIRLTIGNTTAIVNGVSVELEAAPFIGEGGRTVIPLCFVINVIDSLEVYWCDVTQDVVSPYLLEALSDGHIGQALPNGMGTAESINGQTFVPIRFVVDKMGGTIDWDSATQTVTIVI
jgi:hypothetical protein